MIRTTSINIRATNAQEAAKIRCAALARGFGWTAEKKNEDVTDFTISALVGPQSMYEFYCELVGVEA